MRTVCKATGEGPGGSAAAWPLRALLLVALVALTAGCASLPRTAAVQGEILREAGAEARSIAVVEVTRDGLARIARWPAPGAPAERWLTRNGGPDSPVIRPGDRLSLTVWDNDPNSLLTSAGQKRVDITDLPVSPQGTVFVPYLEEVVVAGQTPEEARRMIQTQLDAILPSAQLQLDVAPGRRSSVDLLGGVARPGSYPLPDRNFSVLNLISAGGGVDAGLAHPQLRLVRDGQVYGIALERLKEEPRLDVVLRGGDTVSVEPDRRSFTALGAAGNQAVVPFGRAEVTALDAVSMIGGVAADRGAPGGVLVLREYPAAAVRPDGIAGPDRAQVVFTLDLTTAEGLFSARRFHVAPGDLVLVTEAPVNSLRTILGIVGQTLGLVNRLE
jgi:polysaccharide export outer membrane protein